MNEGKRKECLNNVGRNNQKKREGIKFVQKERRTKGAKEELSGGRI